MLPFIALVHLKGILIWTNLESIPNQLIVLKRSTGLDVSRHLVLPEDVVRALLHSLRQRVRPARRQAARPAEVPISRSLNVSVRPAGTPHSAVWTTPVATRPSRWWTGGGWRGTRRPTSWRMRKRSETPAPDGGSLLVCVCVCVSFKPPHPAHMKTHGRYY